MSQTESFRARREALVLRLRDGKKLTYQQIASRLDLSKSRIGQIYHAARHKILFPPNGLSNRINRLLTLSGFTIEKEAIAIALRTGKLYPGFLPRNYGIFAHRDVCRWAGVDPATLTWPSHDYEPYPDNGLTYRTNNFLKSAGIPATKAAVLQSLKNGDLKPTKRPIGYGKMTHAELCRWVGVTPHQFRKTEKVASQ
jgi:transcriptional regulator with XRE-family HTH domain